MEKIISIEEVYGLRLGNTGRDSEKARLGMVQMMNAVFGGYGEYDGYKIKTSEHEYLILIDNGQCCCEDWGYFSSDDDLERFIGKNLLSVECTDTALNTQKVEKTAPYGFDCGGIQFVDFKMSDGSVLQFAVYNEHNGYYGHPIIIAKDENIIKEDTL
jgi:hypothetical protein